MPKRWGGGGGGSTPDLNSRGGSKDFWGGLKLTSKEFFRGRTEIFCKCFLGGFMQVGISLDIQTNSKESH